MGFKRSVRGADLGASTVIFASDSLKAPTRTAADSGNVHTFPPVSNGIATVAQSNLLGVCVASASWGAATVQYVDDRVSARALVQAAGRRMVRQYGDALERLAE
jgi:hypothetical protein